MTSKQLWRIVYLQAKSIGKEIKLVDTYKLEEKIKESGKTKTYLAKKLKISRVWLGAKINNKTPFNNPETEILCRELSITAFYRDWETNSVS